MMILYMRPMSKTQRANGGLLDEVSTVDMGAAQVGLEGYNFVLMGLKTVGQDGLTAIREIRVGTGEAGSRIRNQAGASCDDDPSYRLPVMNQLFEAIEHTLLPRA